VALRRFYPTSAVIADTALVYTVFVFFDVILYYTGSTGLIVFKHMTIPLNGKLGPQNFTDTEKHL